MPSTSRSRRLDAPAQHVWEVVSDPHHMPRWWPEVRRMEGVQDERFTQVFLTRKGRSVRADHHVVESEPPGPGGSPAGHVSWAQEVEGTPFERVLSQATTEVRVQGGDSGTLVTISQSQKLRGYSRTGGFLLRRAMNRKLDQALDGLEQLLG